MSRFCLTIDTPPQWAARAEPHIETILLDHAHCEKRAASTALNFIFRYPDTPNLVRTMTALCREEMQHFALVCELLERRGIAYRRLAPSPYAGQLMAAARRAEPERLLDHLLLAALIEARSCERFEVLGAGLADGELTSFFLKLAIAEDRHYTTYLELARGVYGASAVEARLGELAGAEAGAAAISCGQPRLHDSFGLINAGQEAPGWSI
jgi:tRNA 2-(methylsulfanyl)-N6-isopentenyladenosine37 hydroxylase